MKQRIGGLYGPDISYLSIPKCDLRNTSSLEGKDVIIIGAPYDGGTSYRPGTRFGPQAIRLTDYIPHDNHRPHIVTGIDPLQELSIADAGDSLMPPTDINVSLQNLRNDIAIITKNRCMPDSTGW